MTGHRDDGDDIDPGPPIAALRDLEEDTSERFLASVHNRVDRRVVTGQFVQLFGTNVFAALLEYVTSLFQAIGGSDRRSPRE